MKGVRPMLFGIAIILASGFVLVHDLIRYGFQGAPGTGFAYLGLLVGLGVNFFGLVYGLAPESAAGE